MTSGAGVAPINQSERARSRPRGGLSAGFCDTGDDTCKKMLDPKVRVTIRCLARTLALALLVAGGCSDGTSRATGASDVQTRGFRMGFSAFPPRPNETDYLRSVEMWIPRADAAILHESVPWAALLGGTSAEVAVRALHLSLVQGYRGRGLDVVFTIDVTDGVDRTSEAPGLVTLGRSITEPEVQQVYRDYALAVARVLQPSYLGLAAETNLIRLAAPRPVYDALVTMTGAASRDLAAAGLRVPLYVSAQVETAWGRLGGGGAFVGIETDQRDFPFVSALGLSSYPYLGGFAEPEQVPVDYYGRVNASRLPLLVVEGGWTSASVGGIASSPDEQARWIRRQVDLATQADARYVFQLLFTDLDLVGFGQAGNPQLVPFATMGLVTSDLVPKPALAAWDAAFARPRR